MNDEDSIEDDWKIARPIRRDPDEEPSPRVGVTPSYVWVSFSYRGSEIPGRFRVEVPTMKTPVIREGRSIRQPEDVYIVQGELPPDRGGYRYDQLNLYLTETGRNPVANASGNHMRTYQGPLDWIDLSFIIDGPGKLTVLHEPLSDDPSGSWRVSPWYDELPGEPSMEINEEITRFSQGLHTGLHMTPAERQEFLRPAQPPEHTVVDYLTDAANGIPVNERRRPSSRSRG